MSRLACRGLDVSIADIQVTRSLDLSLVGGESWSLLGPNGIGKTTLLRCLAGLIEPDAGEIEMEAQPLSAMTRRNVARKLGMLQQHTVYLFDAEVLQIALTGRHPHLKRWDREGKDDVRQAEAALHAVDLEGFSRRGVTSLSGGEARRLAFAALLVQDPEILLLDEPTNHLDMRHQLQIMEITAQLVSRGRRIAFTALHDVNLAVQYSSHALMLFGGGEWQAGPSREVLTRANLERLYGCEVESVETETGPRFYPLAGASLATSWLSRKD
jgi:iron complex transport system ATP-binding protein